MNLDLILLKDNYSIYKFDPDFEIPEVIYQSDFYSVTKTTDELSIICNESIADLDTAKKSKGWRILKVKGPLDFFIVGIIAEISRILKENNIPIFSISTFDTDYILVKNRELEKAINSLQKNGHNVEFEF